jgi:aryl carrier-like protein
MDADDIDSDDTFIDIGMDSITGLEWIKSVNKFSAVRLLPQGSVLSRALFARKPQTGELSDNHILYMDADDIDSDDTFIDIGMDSITGLEWIKSVNKAYGTSLTAKLSVNTALTFSAETAGRETDCTVLFGFAPLKGCSVMHLLISAWIQLPVLNG